MKSPYIQLSFLKSNSDYNKNKKRESNRRPYHFRTNSKETYNNL